MNTVLGAVFDGIVHLPLRVAFLCDRFDESRVVHPEELGIHVIAAGAERTVADINDRHLHGRVLLWVRRLWKTSIWSKGKAPSDLKGAATVRVVTHFARAARPYFGLG